VETALVLLTSGLVLATGGLVYFTRQLVLEERRSRAEVVAEHRRAVVRAALAEATENCRQWRSREPNRHSQLHQPEPTFERLDALLGELSIPGGVLAYLLWARGFAYTLWERYHNSLIVPAGGEPPQRPSRETRELWEAAVDVFQSIALLLRSHAVGTEELREAGQFFVVPWLEPVPGAPWRELAHQQRHAQEGAPDWPHSSIYAEGSPSARDQRAAELGERQKTALY
jgi:hypothetical protein